MLLVMVAVPHGVEAVSVEVGEPELDEDTGEAGGEAVSVGMIEAEDESDGERGVEDGFEALFVEIAEAEVKDAEGGVEEGEGEAVTVIVADDFCFSTCIPSEHVEFWSMRCGVCLRAGLMGCMIRYKLSKLPLEEMQRRRKRTYLAVQ